MLWLALGIVVGGLVILYLGRRRPRAGALRRRLNKLVHDPKVAARLLAGERSRRPGASEAEILRRVVHRLERERSR